jgi:hypothetical protein
LSFEGVGEGKSEGAYQDEGDGEVATLLVALWSRGNMPIPPTSRVPPKIRSIYSSFYPFKYHASLDASKSFVTFSLIATIVIDRYEQPPRFACAEGTSGLRCTLYEVTA